MNKELEQDVIALKKDLGKFRDDISGMLSDVGNFSHDKVRQTKERLKTAISDFEGTAAEKAGRANEYVHEKAGYAVDTSRELVSERPLTTVLVSFAAGALTALLMGKCNHE